MSVKDILSNTIRPVFKRHLDQHEVFNKQRIKYKSKLDNDTHEQQEWKKGDYVDTLRWIIQDTQEVEENLALLIPPLLILVDDYDIEYKVMGIQLIHTLMTKVEIDVLSQHGIDKVFSESMFSCLLYLSEERDIPLIKVAYPCLLHLISCIKNKETRLSLYERVLSDGLLVAFAHAGDKIAFLPHLLVHIPRLYHELQWIGVKYLKTLIPYLCHLLSSSPSIRTRHLNPFIIDALVTIIQWCWPRIPAYKGLLMASIAKSWHYACRDQDEDMQCSLKKLYKVFEAACQGEEQSDKYALLEYNARIYQPLFTQ